MLLRFAVSPLWETVAALRALTAPGRPPVHRRWAAWAEPRLADLGPDPSLLTGLATMPVVPEFLIPTPDVRSLDMDTALHGLPEVARPERVAAALPDDPRAGPLLDDRAGALPAVLDRLRRVYDAVVAPVWPRLEGLLQGDIERRGRTLVDRGGRAVLDGLPGDVGWHPDGAEVRGRPVVAGERDLVLVPSAFTWPDAYLRDGPCRLALCYPAHGFGSLWDRPAAPARDGLAQLVGPTRARLLVALGRPGTVSELAARLGITVGAVSQHLGVLRAAGLAVGRREGRHLVSLRTDLGSALVERATGG
ncbi:winged helix-turn-helix domain-containing protein [Actinosynnema sp. NPDC050436]|uniref:ArsR/SmtB family transcription factor n=1 Tax=Actinosynnema sp. NPDC050436 TaxID=3155659 RepID=UPI0033EF9163